MPKQKRRHWNSVESRLHFAKPYADGFENWLQDHGYTPSTIEERVRLLAGWADWMHAAGFSLDNILEGLAASAAVFKGKKSIRAYAGAGRLFICFLQDQAMLPRSAPPPSLAEQWPILGAFCSWARQHRGIAHSTLDLWQRSIIDMLNVLGEDPKAYTAAALRAFMLERAKRHKIPRLTRIIHDDEGLSGGCSKKRAIHIANRCWNELRFESALRHSRHERRYAASL